MERTRSYSHSWWEIVQLDKIGVRAAELFRRIRAGHERRVAKRRLQNLSDHMLQDIGLSRADVGLYPKGYELTDPLDPEIRRAMR